jgi:ABC-type multidrug transport system ATPase subunit
MIDLEDIELELGGKVVLRGVSARVLAGDKAVIHGESGSGKTSLLKVLIGLNRPSRGKVLIDGAPLSPETMRSIRSRTFYMPQEVRPIGEETAAVFLDFFFGFASTRRGKPSREELLAALERFRLGPELLESKLSDLSGGERQRMGLVRGLLLKRELMLLDEVTSAVDEENKRLIVEHLLGLEGVTIVAVTHDPRFIEGASLRIELNAGEVVRIERPGGG